MPKRVIMPPVERLKIKKRSLPPLEEGVETQTCACILFQRSRSHPTNCGNCAHDERYHTTNSIGKNIGRCTARYLVRRNWTGGAYDPSDTLLGGQGGGVYYEEMPPDETEIESEIHD